jgi:hypothetical protein
MESGELTYHLFDCLLEKYFLRDVVGKCAAVPDMSDGTPSGAEIVDETLGVDVRQKFKGRESFHVGRGIVNLFVPSLHSSQWRLQPGRGFAEWW